MMCPICYNLLTIPPDLRTLYIRASHGLPITDSEKCSHTNNPQMIHNATTTAMMIPDSLNIATLFPAAAIRPNRPAEPLRVVLIEEKVSDYNPVSPAPIFWPPRLLHP